MRTESFGGEQEDFFTLNPESELKRRLREIALRHQEEAEKQRVPILYIDGNRIDRHGKHVAVSFGSRPRLVASLHPTPSTGVGLVFLPDIWSGDTRAKVIGRLLEPATVTWSMGGAINYSTINPDDPNKPWQGRVIVPGKYCKVLPVNNQPVQFSV